MPEREEHQPPWQIHTSGVIVNELRRLQFQAAHEGRGEQMLASLRQIYHRLQREPTVLGEELYRLPAMRMQLRMVVARPLVVDFAVCEDRPLVFIRGAKLLTKLAPQSEE